MITPIQQRGMVGSYAWRLPTRLQQLALFCAMRSGRDGAEITNREAVERLDFETLLRRLSNRTSSSHYARANKQPDSISDSAEQVVEKDYVRQVLLEIPSRQRAVLVLHDVYGHTCEEIASMLEITLAATKMRLCRGREEFRVRYLHREA